MNKKTVFICFGFLILLSVAFWLITPLGIDFEPNALRVGELSRELTRPGGSFPVYIYRDLYNHYGYPIPIFYGSISLLPFALLVVAGMSVVSAYKLMIISAMWLSFCVAYLCLRDISDAPDVVFIGAFLYAIQPFAMIELYVRSANSGGFVFVFLPMALLGLYRIICEKGRGEILLAVGMSGIITAHVTSTVIITVALAVIFFVRLPAISHKLKAFVRVILSALLCALLSAWYLLPLLEQLVQTEYIGSSVKTLMIPRENALSLLIPMHVTMALSKVMHTDLTYSMIGGAAVTMIATLIWIVAHRVHLTGLERTLTGVYIGIIIILLIYWQPIESYVAFIQFAWRIFIIASVAECGLIVSLAERRADAGFTRFRLWLGIVTAVYVLIAFFGYYAIRNISPAFVEDVAGHEVDTTYTYTSDTSDELYLPLSVDKASLYNEERRVEGYDYEINEAEGYVDVIITEPLSADASIEVPFIMYPGYSATDQDGGTSYEVSMSGKGLTLVALPAGYKGVVRVKYTGTDIQRISYILSLLTGAIIILVVGVTKWKKGTRKSSHI